MNLTDDRYRSFALVREMMEAPDLLAQFDYGQTKSIAEKIKKTGKLFFSGEGSSRIFPSKSFIHAVRQSGLPLEVSAEGSRQAMEYDLSNWAVFVSSNSGQTSEAIDLMAKLRRENHPQRYVLTANPQAKLIEFAHESVVLSCGKEQAVAATKSVAEQALVYFSILYHLTGSSPKSVRQAADCGKQILNAEYESSMITPMTQAGAIYFAGRNNGVAEELALKTNEITRQKSGYLEGTFLLHGIEEIMQPNDVIVLIDPFEAEWKRIKERFVDTLHLTVIAVAGKKTLFPTIEIPSLAGYDPFFQLFAGWNLLVQIGTACNINIDKPLRARKIGNEYVERCSTAHT
jgi:glucosamine--fructose-6-phosphate aminotransferase (isomerizing)